MRESFSLERLEPPRVSRGGFFHQPFFLGSLLIFSAVLILYSASFGHNFFFDEENIIVRNPWIRSLALIPELFRHGYFYFEGKVVSDWSEYYRPLTSLTFALDYQFWKLDPFGYNLTNALLHAAVCILLFWLLDVLLKNRTAAFFSSFLFSVHALHTEAVTYIASRGDLLGALLILACLLSYAARRLAAAVGFYALALFAKESTILLPIFVALMDFCFVRSSRRLLLKRMALFVLTAVSFIVFRKIFSPIPLGPPEGSWAGAPQRLLSMGAGFLNYLQAIIYPDNFKFCQKISFVSSLRDPQALKTAFVFSLAAAFWAWAWKSRGAVFFGWGVFLTALTPYLQWVHFYPEWAEHYLYIPMIGLTFVLASFIAFILKSGSRRTVLAFFAVYACFFTFLCVRTWQRNQLYNDTVKFYQRLAGSDSPYAFFGYQNLARLAIERGAWDEAIVPLKTAEAIEPLSDVTHNLLGQYYLEKERFAEALGHFKKAYEYSNHYDKFLMNVGITHIRMGQYRDAIAVFEAIQKKSSHYASVYTNLITAYELAGEPRRALRWAEDGFQILKDRRSEYTVLVMATVRLAYRQGWEELARVNFTHLAEQYADVFWYGDVSMLFSGKINHGDFLKMVNSKYPGFRSVAIMNVLMALVLQGKKDEAARFLKDYSEVIESEAARHPLMKAEAERARKYALSF